MLFPGCELLNAFLPPVEVPDDSRAFEPTGPGGKGRRSHSFNLP